MEKIVIIGASSGIGLALAQAYASAGIKLGLAARNTAPLEALSHQYPGLIEHSAIDVKRPDAPALLRELAGRIGGMDTYIHVAGIGYDNPTLDPQREADIVSTNAVGFVRMISAAYDYFRDNSVKGAHIAAVTSVAGTNGIGQLAAYSASKKCAQTYMVALEQLARSEHADVSFTDIRPGWIRTPLLYSDRKYPLEMTPDYAVARIVRAIRLRKRVAVIDWRWNLIVGLWRCIPNSLWTRLPYKV